MGPFLTLWRHYIILPSVYCPDILPPAVSIIHGGKMGTHQTFHIDDAMPQKFSTEL
jgi:hypothetical protein